MSDAPAPEVGRQQVLTTRRKNLQSLQMFAYATSCCETLYCAKWAPQAAQQYTSDIIASGASPHHTDNSGGCGSHRLIVIVETLKKSAHDQQMSYAQTVITRSARNQAWQARSHLGVGTKQISYGTKQISYVGAHNLPYHHLTKWKGL